MFRISCVVFVVVLWLVTGCLSVSFGRDRKTRDRKSSAMSKSTPKAKSRGRHTLKYSVNTGKSERRQLNQRRLAGLAHQAALARERALDEALRNRVQAMIARDDLSGEDPEIRQIALNALGHRAGTVVVMDPQTGRIFSIVNQEWALREAFKPCSTIKLVTGVAGLNEQVIEPVSAAGGSELNQVDLTRALAYSKNGYFQEVGGQVGFAKMIFYARELGLGERTGINGMREIAGHLPAAKSGYGLNRMSSHGDDFGVTAMQLGTLVSALGNGGWLLSPQIVRSSREASRFGTKVRRQVRIEQKTFRNIVPGMVGAVNYGSGRKAYHPAATVAGKTGTCIESGRWVGLFASYAPLAQPRLAVVVIARGTDARNHFPATVAGRIYRELGSRFGTPANIQLASAEEEVHKQPDEDYEQAQPKREGTIVNSSTHRADATNAPQHSSKGRVKPVLMQISQANQQDPASHTRPRRVFASNQ